MTVRELKEKLNEFDDNLIVMIPNERLHLLSNPFWCVPVTHIYQGFNEEDGCLFVENSDKGCETCIHYDVDLDDQPCCSCVDGENWEEYKDD